MPDKPTKPLMAADGFDVMVLPTTEHLRKIARRMDVMTPSKSGWAGDVRDAANALDKLRAELERVRSDLEPLHTDLDQVKTDVAKLLEGFDEGVFVRNVYGDEEPTWAMKLLPYLAAMGRLAALQPDEADPS